MITMACLDDGADVAVAETPPAGGAPSGLGMLVGERVVAGVGNCVGAREAGNDAGDGMGVGFGDGIGEGCHVGDAVLGRGVGHGDGCGVGDGVGGTNTCNSRQKACAGAPSDATSSFTYLVVT